jgi:hypothetical protein
MKTYHDALKELERIVSNPDYKDFPFVRHMLEYTEGQEVVLVDVTIPANRAVIGLIFIDKNKAENYRNFYHK